MTVQSDNGNDCILLFKSKLPLYSGDDRNRRQAFTDFETLFGQGESECIACTKAFNMSMKEIIVCGAVTEDETIIVSIAKTDSFSLWSEVRGSAATIIGKSFGISS
jgi:hypothetical protein